MVQLMIAEETVWGTTLATPVGIVIPVSGIGGEWYRRNLIDNPELRGNRNPASPVRGNVVVNGSFQVPLHLDAIGWILKHGVGKQDTTGTTSPYIHTGKINWSDGTEDLDLPVGLSVEVGFTDIGQYHVYDGCRINSLAVSATSEGVCVFDVGVVGQGVTQGVASMDASPTTYTSSAIDHFAATIKEGGGATTIVTDVSLSLNNNLDTSMYVIGGAGSLGDLPTGMASVTGSLTALFQSDALLTKGRSHTESSLELTWTSGTDSLVLTVPELVYEPAAPTISGPAGVKASMNFRGYYANGAKATALEYVLTNTVATY
jgi:hypothetical protein